MKSTSIGYRFIINDLSAEYELVGSSDNYSFRHKLGRGSDLVDFQGEEYSQSIDLKGNYGDFSIRIYAINNVGIRSKYIEENISIAAPTFKETFKFNNLRIESESEEISNVISQNPSDQNNKLIVNSTFVGKEARIKWELIPPTGHPKEGSSLSQQLLTDPFFDRFYIAIKDENQNILNSEIVNNSAALANYLGQESSLGALANYGNFEFVINREIFSELNLTRNFSVEIISYDSYGARAYAEIFCENKIPQISSFEEILKLNSISFSWFEDSDDPDYVEVTALSVPAGTELYNIKNLQESVNYLRAKNAAQSYSFINNYNYKKGDKYLYTDDNVYEAIQDHIGDEINRPGNQEYWSNIGPVVGFDLINDKVYNKEFSLKLNWSKSYYFSFEIYDQLGSGGVYNLTSEGIDLVENEAVLDDRTYEIKLDNIRYRERGDSIIFDWDIVDANNSAIDIEQLKVTDQSSLSNLLGIYAYLYDVETGDPVFIVTPGFQSRHQVETINGSVGVVENLISTKIFNSFEYSRALNNAIYVSEGYPEGTEFFNKENNYQAGDYVISEYSATYKCLLTNEYNQLKIQPEYYEWDPNFTYSEIGYCTLYQDKVYQVDQDFGPDSSMIRNVFDVNEVYNLNDFIVAPTDSSISLFDSSLEYQVGKLVYADQKVFRSIRFQSAGQASYPSLENFDHWQLKDINSDISFGVFKSLTNFSAASNILPAKDEQNWELQTPETCVTHFSLKIDSYSLNIREWSTIGNYSISEYIIYDNDIWFCKKNNGPSQDSGSIIPGSNQDYWVNTNQNGEDFVTNHKAGDLVFYREAIYKCLSDNPTGGPLVSVETDGDRESISSYDQCKWQPFWQLTSEFEGLPIGHIGIPEQGKRSIGISLELLDSRERTLSSVSIDAENPAPYILENEEHFLVTATRETESVQFDFKYALGFQEKTTKVHLYRSSEPNFSITGVDKLPYSQVAVDKNDPSTLVNIVIGAGDATFGENITRLIDYPPIPSVPDYEKYVNENQGIYEQYILENPLESKEDWAENYWETIGELNGDVMPYKDTSTGYYYKILPFDDFGSGVLHDVRIGDQGLVTVLPKTFHDKSPYASNGPVVRATASAAEGLIPLPITNFQGEARFENFFLNWYTPDDDIDFFEVWSNRENFDGDTKSLITGIEGGETGYFEQQNNKGYRRIAGEIYSIGDDHPREQNDESWRIRNAYKIFDVPSNGKNISTVYPGRTNEARNFWVRSVDKAGNKSPFTGALISPQDNIQGLNLRLETASATDISDFEINMTERFGNSVALVPTNPFRNNTDDGSISWIDHVLYYQGTGHFITGDTTYSGYVWWDIDDQQKNIPGSYEYGNLNNILYSGGYKVSDAHPQGGYDSDKNYVSSHPDFNDSDFIIARNNAGNASPVFYAMPNALIGTANIAEAAVDSARIKDLTADKILAGTISGKDITIWSEQGENGAVRTLGFDGVDHNYDDRKGFLLSGDGSFAFQAGKSSLSLQNDTLTLVGKIRQSDTKDYDFIDLDVFPDYFNYIEGNNGFELESNASLNIEATFRNTSLISINQASDVYFKMQAVIDGQTIDVFDYGDGQDGYYGNSGFVYNYTDAANNFKIKEDGSVSVRATFEGGFGDNDVGFHDIITSQVDSNGQNITGEAVILYVSGANSSYEKRTTISRVIDGKIGANAKSVRINAESLVFKKDKDDGSVSPARIKLTAVTQNTSSTNVSWSGSTEIYTDENGTTKVGTTLTNQVWVDRAALTNGKVTITATIEGVSDSTTLIIVEDGSNNVQAVLSNESHTLTELSNGNFDLTGSGTDIQVFDGSNLLQYTTGTLTSGKFKVADIQVAGGVVYGTSSTTEGSTTYTISDLSSDTTGAGTVTFTITAIKGNGDPATLTKVQSFAVSKFGQNGDPGPATPYRGDWLKNKNNLSTNETITYEKNDNRADIVFYNDGGENKYWICKNTHDVNPGDTFVAGNWDPFGATFSSVATDLLLSEDVVITSTITVGSSDSTPPSYFKFDADAGRLDMRGAVVNNTIAQDVGDQLTDINLNGSASIGFGGTIINGTSTAFTTDLDGENFIRLTNGDNQQIFTIVSVGSDTQITVKESSLFAFSSATIYKEKSIATFIGGGYNNSIDPFSLNDGGYQSLASSVVGGAYNNIIGRFSFIGNGFRNECKDNFSAIVGGYQNTMPKLDSANQGANFIGAGQNNTINGGTNQSILGGSDNQIIN